MNDKPTAMDNRSVRMDEWEWATASALALLFRERGASAGLRRALDMAVSQVVREGLVTDECPRGHPFVWGNSHQEGQSPATGDWVTCAGGEGYLCGYSFVWRGHDHLKNLVNKIVSEREQ